MPDGSDDDDPDVLAGLALAANVLGYTAGILSGHPVRYWRGAAPS